MIMTKPAAVTNVNPVRANAAKPVAVVTTIGEATARQDARYLDLGE